MKLFLTQKIKLSEDIMPIVIAGQIDLESGKNRDKVIDSAKPYIEASWDEDGCIAYDWTADPFKDNRIHVFEEWADEKSLAAHLVGQPYLDMLGHLQGAGIASTRAQKYRVDLIEPVYDDTGTPRADFYSLISGRARA